LSSGPAWSEIRNVWDNEAGGRDKIATLPAPSMSRSISPKDFCMSTSKIIFYMLHESVALKFNSVIAGGSFSQ